MVGLLDNVDDINPLPYNNVATVTIFNVERTSMLLDSFEFEVNIIVL